MTKAQIRFCEKKNWQVCGRLEKNLLGGSSVLLTEKVLSDSTRKSFVRTNQSLGGNQRITLTIPAGELFLCVQNFGRALEESE